MVEVNILWYNSQVSYSVVARMINEQVKTKLPGCHLALTLTLGEFALHLTLLTLPCGISMLLV